MPERHMYLDPLLPLEVLYMVVDELGRREDFKTLKACALVRRAFVAHCRRHIYNSVTVTINAYLEYSTRNLCYTITSNSQIALYVRSLTLIDLDPTYSWTRMAYPLSRLLEALSKLESFSLIYSVPKALSEESRLSLVDLLELPTFRTLKLSNISGVFPKDLVFFTFAQELYLSGIEFDRLQLDNIIHFLPFYYSTSNRSKLQSLTLEGNSSTAFHLLAHLFPDTLYDLQKVCIGPHPNILRDSWDVVTVAANTITRLEWLPDIRSRFHTNLDIIDLSILPNLRYLKIGILFILRPFYQLIHLLSTVGEGNLIEVIEIICDLSELKQLHDHEGWRELEDVLTGPYFREFRHLLLDLPASPQIAQTKRSDKLSAILRVFKQELPKLQDKISVSVDH